MRAFAELFEAIDRTTSTNAKVDAMAAYFADADAADAAWAVRVLAGERVKRLVPRAVLHEWLLKRAGVSAWLVEESHAVVGDFAETAALLLESAGHAGADADGDRSLASWFEDRILTLRGMERSEQVRCIDGWTREVSGAELFVLLKLVTGALRVGVSRTLTERAIARVAGVDQSVIAHRLMGSWDATPEFWERLVSAEAGEAEAGRPYPFYLASPVDPGVAIADQLGDVRDWLIEWKWDGIRAQVIKRAGEVTVWSRGDENLTERFPEITDAAARLADGTVLDAELVCWDGERVLPFSVLQRRIGRKVLSARVLREAPAALIAYDVLEVDGEDVRARPQRERRDMLVRVVGELGASRVMASEVLEVGPWEKAAALRESSRERGTEGLMLKAWDGGYEAGRRRGGWWKWKVDPLTVDAVMVYAQPGRGRRANLLTDYTFAVWDGDELTPVTKAYSGLDNEEIAEVDKWIRRHTTERFGPVRAVEPVRVFEIAFEGIARSSRHKSGVALRFPRIARVRDDKPAAEADTLDTLVRLIDGEASEDNGEEG